MKIEAAFLVLSASVAGATHYTYVGRDPDLWTASRLEQQFIVVPPPDYTTNIADVNQYMVKKIITDSAGNTYVTGGPAILVSPYPAISFLSDIFVTKLDTSGKIVFTATIGGKGGDIANDIALDADGNIYIAGSTGSPNFPLRNALQRQVGSGFILKLSADGSRLIYSTYFCSEVNAITVDANGNMYITGSMNCADFEATPGLPYDHPSSGMSAHEPAFIVKVSSAGDQILFSALLGGDAPPCDFSGSSCFLSTRHSSANAIALDGAGNVVVVGNSFITDLPTTPGAFMGAGLGPFAAKVKADGTGMIYITYLGAGNGSMGSFNEPENLVTTLAVDAAGNAYVAGSTTDTNFPATPGALQTHYAGQPNQYLVLQPNAFIGKLNSSGTAMVWATYLGATGADAAQSIAIDAQGNAWVAGTTQSPEFPNTNGWTSGGDFLVEINSTGSALSYAARFPDGSVSQSVALDPSGLVHVAGMSGIVSVIAPTRPPSARVFGVVNDASQGNLAGRVAPGEIVSIYGPGIGPSTPATFAPDISGLVPKMLAGVEVSIGGFSAPLLYVSATQINAIVPFEVANNPIFASPPSSTYVHIVLNGVATPDFPLIVTPSDPEVFRNADGSAAAVNQDGSLNSAMHPAKIGSIVAIWATGTGA